MGIARELNVRLEELRAEARYARERRDLYRAKVVGRRATSPARLEELERACTLSEARLRRAEAELEPETAEPDTNPSSLGHAKRARTDEDEERRSKLKQVRRQLKARALERARRLRRR